MLKTWKNVIFKPGKRVFAVERDKSSSTLKAALAWVLVAGIVGALLDILLNTLTAAWIMPINEVDFSKRSDLMTTIFDFIMILVIRYLHLNLEFVDLYGWLWAHSGLFDLMANPVHRVVSFITLDIPDWQRIIAKGLLRPVSFLIHMGVYHSVAVLLGGRGQFGRYAYLLAMIAVPFVFLGLFIDFLFLAVAGVVAVSPGSSPMAGQVWHHSLEDAGSFVIRVVFLAYLLVLSCFATSVEHEIAWWRVVIIGVLARLIIFVIGTVWPFAYLGMLQAPNFLHKWGG